MSNSSSTADFCLGDCDCHHVGGLLSIITLRLRNIRQLRHRHCHHRQLPGASAKTVEDSVTQVIEQKMKGIDGLRYMARPATPPRGQHHFTFENAPIRHRASAGAKQAATGDAAAAASVQQLG